MQYESGGKLFYPVFTRTLVALLLSHITLIGYCVVLGTRKSKTSILRSHLMQLQRKLTCCPAARLCCRGDRGGAVPHPSSPHHPALLLAL